MQLEKFMFCLCKQVKEQKKEHMFSFVYFLFFCWNSIIPFSFTEYTFLSTVYLEVQFKHTG